MDSEPQKTNRTFTGLEFDLYTMVKNDFFRNLQGKEQENLIHDSVKNNLPGVIYAISRYGGYE